MKKKLCYILLLLFIFRNTALNQLLKLPDLVTHYLEHRQLNNRIGVMEYLSMHYWGKDIDDHDDDRDQQLPFKTMDAHSVPHSFVPLSKAIVLHYHDAPFISVNYPVTKDNYLPDPATNSLFRPPRA